MPRPQPGVGEQLRTLLVSRNVSQRELARRLLTDGKSGRPDEKAWKSRTRWVQKVVRGDVEIPEQASLAAIERALGAPGYFNPPARERSAVRREQLEAKVARLEERQETQAAGWAAFLQRVEDLETAVAAIAAAVKSDQAAPRKRRQGR